MREILDAAGKGNPRALLAVKAFCYRIKRYIGAFAAALGGADALVFTGGIGENSRGIRFRSVQGLEKLGFAVDPVRNGRCAVSAASPVCDISARYSNVNILVIATDEELMIARHCARALDFKRRIRRDLLSTDRRPVRVAVSVRHAHLSTGDVEALFGKGHVLTEKSRLHLDTDFASQETVSLVGPRGRVDNVRVIGPERAKTQVEISRTEEFKLGIDAPVRESGDLDGTPGIVLEGPAGSVEIPEGVICAMRHIHMTPGDAENYGVKDRDRVMVRIEGERELIFGDVLVRVKPGYKLEMHIDTDEGNAAELPPSRRATWSGSSPTIEVPPVAPAGGHDMAYFWSLLKSVDFGRPVISAAFLTFPFDSLKASARNSRSIRSISADTSHPPRIASSI